MKFELQMKHLETEKQNRRIVVLHKQVEEKRALLKKLQNCFDG